MSEYEQDVGPGQAVTVKVVDCSEADDARMGAMLDYVTALERAGQGHLVGDHMLQHWYAPKEIEEEAS